MWTLVFETLCGTKYAQGSPSQLWLHFFPNHILYHTTYLSLPLIYYTTYIIFRYQLQLGRGYSLVFAECLPKTQGFPRNGVLERLHVVGPLRGSTCGFWNALENVQI